MIEHLAVEHIANRTFRLATVGDTNEATLASMGITDPAAMLTILRTARPDDPNRLLDGPFEPKPHYTPKQSRYSDGTFPVYYSALDRQTARAEMRHQARLRFLGVPSIPGMSIFLRDVECTFAGPAKDLRPERETIPHLVGEESDGAYDTCNAIAREARAVGLHGLLAPSARAPEGTCLPAFARESLSEPALGNWVTFRHDPVTDSVECIDLP